MKDLPKFQPEKNQKFADDYRKTLQAHEPTVKESMTGWYVVICLLLVLIAILLILTGSKIG